MAKSDLGMYMTPSAKGYLKAQRPRMITPTRSSKTIDPSLSSGKTAAKGAPLASRPIEGGPALPSPQAYNPIIDAESGEDPNAPRVETQQPIENRGDSARYMIQGGGPRIDLSFLVPERANKAYDPSKAIGGENVPYQESKGVGGFFRRLLGDESNRMNIEAQQAQGAEWREAEKEAQKEERLLNRMREADKPTQARFEASQQASRDAEANRVAAENKRLELEGKRVGLTERQIEEARLDRIERLKGEQADRDARIEDMRTRNALADYTVSQNQLKSNQLQMIGLRDGGMGVMNPADGSISIVNSGTAGFGNIPGTPSTTKQVYPPPQFKPSGSGGGQVDRNTGATLGGPLPVDAGAAVTPPRNALMPMDESNRPSQRMVPVQEEESIDPYQLQRTTPSMGTMMEPAGSAARRRARYLSPNMPGWSLGQ